MKKQNLYKDFFIFIWNFFEKIVSGFKTEGKEYINIAFGCTGGVHRSVVASEHFFKFLTKNKKIKISIDHRDLKK